MMFIFTGRSYLIGNACFHDTMSIIFMHKDNKGKKKRLNYILGPYNFNFFEVNTYNFSLSNKIPIV